MDLICSFQIPVFRVVQQREKKFFVPRLHGVVFSAVLLQPLQLHHHRDRGEVPHLILDSLLAVPGIVSKFVVRVQDRINVLQCLDVSIAGHLVVMENLRYAA